MSTTDIHRLSDSCISTVDIYGESERNRNELLPESRGVRGAMVLINVINCIAGKWEWDTFYACDSWITS